MCIVINIFLFLYVQIDILFWIMCVRNFYYFKGEKMNLPIIIDRTSRDTLKTACKEKSSMRELNNENC